MGNKFKDIWIKKHHFEGMIEEENAGADKYHAMADAFSEMAEDEDKHGKMLEDLETKKAGNVVCPNCGEMLVKSILDDVMKEVENATTKSQLDAIKVKLQKYINKAQGKRIIFTMRNGGGSYSMSVQGDANKENWGKMDGQTVVDYEAKAIETDAKNDGYQVIWKSVDTSYAGDIPHSKLARQDLEGKKKAQGFYCDTCQRVFPESQLNGDLCPVCGEDIKKAQMKVCPHCEEKTPADEDHCENCGWIFKGAIEQTGKQLDQASKKAEDVEDETEKDGLIRNIKAIQLKRQKAVEEARKSGSFKDSWKQKYER